MESILLVDVPIPYHEAVASKCRFERYHVTSAHGSAVLVTGDLPSMAVIATSGQARSELERVREVIKTVHPSPLVVLAANAGVEFAIRLMRLGVEDVIELSGAPSQLAEKCFRVLADSGQSWRDPIVGESPPMLELRRRTKAAARVSSTVLIQGETGTGKGLVARAIHAGSDRSDEPFVHVDCAALSPTLVESELFGHERGSFTGATSLRRGRFELSGRGTIFLDEVSEIEPRLQSKLLRVIEDRMYERVGGTQTLSLNARIIAATNRDLRQAVRTGAFRQDLYFRLNVLSIKIVPLRERPSDIPLLVDFAMERLRNTLRVQIPEVTDSFYDHLTDHSWPGNVRELLNLMERAVVHGRGDALEPELLDELLDPDPDLSAEQVLSLTETDDGDASVIAAALRDTGGNVSRTARRLGIPRGTLRYRIRRYGLSDLIPTD